MIPNDLASNENGNGKVSLAIINNNILRIFEELKEIKECYKGHDGEIGTLKEGQTERRTQINAITERIKFHDDRFDKLERKSDNWNALNSIGAFFGAIIAALVGIFVNK